MNTDSVFYKGWSIHYIPRRKGYIVYFGLNYRIDMVFDTSEYAKVYIDSLYNK